MIETKKGQILRGETVLFLICHVYILTIQTQGVFCTQFREVRLFVIGLCSQRGSNISCRSTGASFKPRN